MSDRRSARDRILAILTCLRCASCCEVSIGLFPDPLCLLATIFAQ